MAGDPFLQVRQVAAFDYELRRNLPPRARSLFRHAVVERRQVEQDLPVRRRVERRRRAGRLQKRDVQDDIQLVRPVLERAERFLSFDVRIVLPEREAHHRADLDVRPPQVLRAPRDLARVHADGRKRILPRRLAKGVDFRFRRRRLQAGGIQIPREFPRFRRGFLRLSFHPQIAFPVKFFLSFSL